LYAPPSFLCPAPASCCRRSERCCTDFSMGKSARIAIVGDVHDYWSLEEDTRALRFLKPDLVLFTGDFGNENVDLIASVSNLYFPKAVILGNHDAWSTNVFSSDGKDPVQMQLKILGDDHVGYRRMDFPSFNLSIVGGRPFSHGGSHMFKWRLLLARYGVGDMDASSQRIFEAAIGAPDDHSLVFLAHNGPTGLGSNRDDICGRDWIYCGGDHGDPDLAKAISELRKTTQRIKLVVFGHMHKGLACGGGFRKMVVVGDDGIVYLNGAVVPRVKPFGN
ncbi:hypothetical protein M569_14098, partial [Genlisea aurea]